MGPPFLFENRYGEERLRNRRDRISNALIWDFAEVASHLDPYKHYVSFLPQTILGGVSNLHIRMFRQRSKNTLRGTTVVS